MTSPHYSCVHPKEYFIRITEDERLRLDSIISLIISNHEIGSRYDFERNSSKEGDRKEGDRKERSAEERCHQNNWCKENSGNESCNVESFT